MKKVKIKKIEGYFCDLQEGSVGLLVKTLKIPSVKVHVVFGNDGLPGGLIQYVNDEHIEETNEPLTDFGVIDPVPNINIKPEDWKEIYREYNQPFPKDLIASMYEGFIVDPEKD